MLTVRRMSRESTFSPPEPREPGRATVGFQLGGLFTCGGEPTSSPFPTAKMSVHFFDR